MFKLCNTCELCVWCCMWSHCVIRDLFSLICDKANKSVNVLIFDFVLRIGILSHSFVEGFFLGFLLILFFFVRVCWCCLLF